MKIGLLTASVSRRAGGLYDATRHLAQSLQQTPMEIQILGLKDRETARDLAGWGGLPVQVFGVRGPGFFGYAPMLASALAAAQLDLLHVHGLWMYPSVAGLRWARQQKRPYLITPHGMLDPWAVRNAHWKKRLAGWLYEDAHLRGAACLHALCESEAEAIRVYGLRNPICIIPNGIDRPADAPADSPNWQTDLPDGARVLLYLGRLHPKKGLPNLLLAWSMARQARHSGDEWRLVIAGWDQAGHEDDLKSLARQQGIEDSVHFVGPQFETAKHASYRRADAFIQPSFSEGLPMVVLEAWAYGLPVLMTPQCNLPEGFQAQAALRIAPEPEGISQGLATLFAMADAERVAMGERGRVLVEQRFSWVRIAEQMLAVYQWVLGQGSKPDCVRMD
ncbi:D-inositol 3-phosphate glycosyltransferase [Thiorhodovibrio winogradskyi]|uniref:D-inositol 3-phosphate glycosyltransferase n=1 Tax=Thiorhodovibrio winogradskyi TaxID=77007 RepID=A0ABZ0SI99_9GAMM|nr:glycosyltransferase [Thiorhodovibrio winogradskyi]